jgi:hypothetical protein
MEDGGVRVAYFLLSLCPKNTRYRRDPGVPFSKLKREFRDLKWR